MAVCLLAVAGAWFLFGGAGNGDASKTNASPIGNHGGSANDSSNGSSNGSSSIDNIDELIKVSETERKFKELYQNKLFSYGLSFEEENVYLKLVGITRRRTIE